MDNLMFLTSFANYSETQLAQGLLESHGIKSVAQLDDTGGIMAGKGTGGGPSNIYVKKSDLKKAKEILGV